VRTVENKREFFATRATGKTTLRKQRSTRLGFYINDLHVAGGLPITIWPNHHLDSACWVHVTKSGTDKNTDNALPWRHLPEGGCPGGLLARIARIGHHLDLVQQALGSIDESS
jgi:hypothetical protein